MNYAVALLSLFLFQQAPPEPPPPFSGLQRPTYAPDGRLAFSLDGDLWMLVTGPGADTQWEPLTTGPADDRDPAWASDGAVLVFSSDRAGTYDLWQIEVGSSGPVGEPVRLTQTPEPDAEPVYAPDGSLLFVRGRGADANLWIRTPGGEEQALTETLGAEQSPAVSPDGQHVAYIAVKQGGPQLRVRHLVTRADSLVIGGQPAEYPVWSPDGLRLAFSTRGREPGVWVTDLEGRYANLVSTARARAAWVPGRDQLVLAPLPRTEPAYNGDPARVGPRQYRAADPSDQAFWFVQVPPPPDAGRQRVAVEAPAASPAQNVAAFEKVWGRLDAQYTDAAKARWAALRDQYLPAVQEATTVAELDAVLYALLRARPSLREEASGRAAISSAHPLATAAGMHVLAQGGNVVEAAVAVSFALGVVEPDASGLGGYGEMLIFLKGMDEPVTVEFLTRVPEAASLTNGALLEKGQLPTDGPVLANVPGTVAGMQLAWDRYGSGALEWKEALAPAIKLAEEGFVLDDAFATTLASEKAHYLAYSSSKALFFREDKPLQAGDTLRNPDLAWTLRQIAEGGAAAFYKGEIARRMVDDLRGQGNVMSREDLARYYAAERAPVKGVYRGHTVYSGPPPVSGGAGLVGKLTLLEQAMDLGSYYEEAGTLHRMIEAWKLAPSTTDRIADPGLWPVDLAPFSDTEWAQRRWHDCFDPERSVAPDDGCLAKEDIAAAWGADGVLDARSSTGTTAFVVADAEGNMVAVTQTLGTWGGNFYVTPGLGFLYNDKLRSYRTDPSRYNARLPFARNVTSIAPTLVFEGTGEAKRPYLALGAAGNAWITSAVYQIVTAAIDQGMGPQEAIELPRFLVSVRRESGDDAKVREVVVQLEDGFAPGVLAELRALGHEVQRISLRGELRMGYAATIQVQDGRVRAGADPRRSGAADALK